MTATTVRGGEASHSAWLHCISQCLNCPIKEQQQFHHPISIQTNHSIVNSHWFSPTGWKESRISSIRNYMQNPGCSFTPFCTNPKCVTYTNIMSLWSVKLCLLHNAHQLQHSNATSEFRGLLWSSKRNVLEGPPESFMMCSW